jgi:hypothetical protein
MSINIPPRNEDQSHTYLLRVGRVFYAIWPCLRHKFYLFILFIFIFINLNLFLIIKFYFSYNGPIF